MQGLPWLFLGAGLGVVVDRTDRRRLMVTVDIARAVVILAPSAGLLLIYAAALVTGIGSALRGTSAATCVPSLVDPAGLDKASAGSSPGRSSAMSWPDRPRAGGCSAWPRPCRSR